MKISLIIPVLNAEKTLLQCFAALACQEILPYELLVIDNGSTDQSVRIIEEAKQRYAQLPLMLLHESTRGPGAARNKGIRQATGDILAFTDADCFPRKDWIKNILRLFQKEALDGVGGLASIFDPKTPLQKLQAIDTLVLPETHNQPLQHAYEVILSGKVIVTFNAAYRKTVFDTIGGFDETLSITGEDAELTIRALRKGFQLRSWHPDLVVFHMPRARFIPYAKRIFEYRVALPLLLKNYFSKEAFILLPTLPLLRFYFPWSFVITQECFFYFFALVAMMIFFLFYSPWFLIGLTGIVGMIIVRLIHTIKRRSNVCGLTISFQDWETMLILDIIKKCFSEYGRIYGSIKYRTFYI